MYSSGLQKYFNLLVASYYTSLHQLARHLPINMTVHTPPTQEKSLFFPFILLTYSELEIYKLLSQSQLLLSIIFRYPAKYFRYLVKNLMHI